MGCKQYAYPLISAAQRLIKVATDAAFASKLRPHVSIAG